MGRMTNVDERLLISERKNSPGEDLNEDAHNVVTEKIRGVCMQQSCAGQNQHQAIHCRGDRTNQHSTTRGRSDKQEFEPFHSWIAGPQKMDVARKPIARHVLYDCPSRGKSLLWEIRNSRLDTGWRKNLRMRHGFRVSLISNLPSPSAAQQCQQAKAAEKCR